MDTERAMSQADADLVRELYAAFEGGDVERALAYFADDAVIDATARIDGGIGHGPGGFVELVLPWVAAFDDWHEQVEEVRDLGDRVCVVAVQSGKAKDTGIEMHTRYAIVYEVDGRAISSMRLYRDPDAALAGT
jgi:ketosteroid isomerase-like protein